MLTVVMSGLISLQVANEPGLPPARAASAALPPQPSTCTSRTPPSSSSRVRPLAGGATGPAVGARFEVVNQIPGHRPWKNPPS
jgi:hypothetical protein